MATYKPDIPQASDIIAISQGDILGNFTYLQESVGKDHNMTDSSNPALTNPDGYHTVIHHVTQVADPAVIAAVGQIYTKNVTVGITTDTQLFFESGLGVISQLTGGNSSGMNGYIYLPGPVLVQWSLTTIPGTTITPTFPIPFPTACFGVVATANNTAILTPTPAVGVYNVTTTNFSMNLTFAGQKVFWIAFGN